MFDDGPLLASPGPNVGGYSPQERPLLDTGSVGGSSSSSVQASSPRCVPRKLSFSEDLLRTPVQRSSPLDHRSPGKWASDASDAGSEKKGAHDAWGESPAAPRPENFGAARGICSVPPELPEVVVPAWRASSTIDGSTQSLPPWPCGFADPAHAQGKNEEDLESEIGRFLCGLGPAASGTTGQRCSLERPAAPVAEGLRPGTKCAAQLRSRAEAVWSSQVLDTSEKHSAHRNLGAEPSSSGTPSLSISSLSTSGVPFADGPEVLDRRVATLRTSESEERPIRPTCPESEPEEYPAEEIVLTQCESCCRNFRCDRLAVHLAICRKASAGRRHVFESRRQRLADLGERWWSTPESGVASSMSSLVAGSRESSATAASASKSAVSPSTCSSRTRLRSKELAARPLEAAQEQRTPPPKHRARSKEAEVLFASPSKTRSCSSPFKAAQRHARSRHRQGHSLNITKVTSGERVTNSSVASIPSTDRLSAKKSRNLAAKTNSSRDRLASSSKARSLSSPAKGAMSSRSRQEQRRTPNTTKSPSEGYSPGLTSVSHASLDAHTPERRKGGAEAQDTRRDYKSSPFKRSPTRSLSCPTRHSKPVRRQTADAAPLPSSMLDGKKESPLELPIVSWHTNEDRNVFTSFYSGAANEPNRGSSEKPDVLWNSHSALSAWLSESSKAPDVQNQSHAELAATVSGEISPEPGVLWNSHSALTIALASESSGDELHAVSEQTTAQYEVDRLGVTQSDCVPSAPVSGEDATAAKSDLGKEPSLEDKQALARLGPLVEEAAVLCAQVDKLLGLQEPDVIPGLVASLEPAREKAAPMVWQQQQLNDGLPSELVSAEQRCASWPRQPYDPSKYCEAQPTKLEMVGTAQPVQLKEMENDDLESSKLQAWLRSCAERVDQRRRARAWA